MPSNFIVEPQDIDTSQLVGGMDHVQQIIQQRYEMQQLEAIVRFDLDNGIAIGYKDQREDDFWVRGHIPGRPLMPGVMMIEASAQLCSYYFTRASQDDRFLGFGGVTDVKFRGQVVPGDRFIIVVKNTEIKPRRAQFDVQGVVNGKLVYEGHIIGMPI